MELFSWREFLRVDASIEALGVPERMPFILGDDGSYDLRLNQFLRELPTMGVRAAKSWLAYARDLLTWIRFLAEQRGRTVWQAEEADVAAFHRARRLGPPETAVSSSTWDRGIATLDKFYRWAAAHGHVERLPFSYRAPRAAAFLTGRRQPEPVNLAKERQGRRQPGFLSVGDYLVFRDVGLRGRCPTARPISPSGAATATATPSSPSCSSLPACGSARLERCSRSSCRPRARRSRRQSNWRRWSARADGAALCASRRGCCAPSADMSTSNGRMPWWGTAPRPTASLSQNQRHALNARLSEMEAVIAPLDQQ